MNHDKDLSMEECLIGWKGGDLKPLARIFNAFKAEGFGVRLRNSAIKLNGSLGITEDDLEQEVFLKLLKFDPQKINDYQHFKAICQLVLKRRIADLVAMSLRGSSQSLDEDFGGDAEVTQTFMKASTIAVTLLPSEDDQRKWFREALGQRLDAVLTQPLGGKPPSEKFEEQIEHIVNKVRWRNQTFTGNMRALVMSHINDLLQSIKQRVNEGDYSDIAEAYNPRSEILKRFFADEIGFGALTRHLQRAADALKDPGPVVALLTLRGLAGYSHEEVCEELGITLDVSKKTWARTKGYLREILGQ